MTLDQEFEVLLDMALVLVLLLQTSATLPGVKPLGCQLLLQPPPFSQAASKSKEKKGEKREKRTTDYSTILARRFDAHHNGQARYARHTRRYESTCTQHTTHKHEYVSE